jgi:DNA polymerase-4
VTGAASEPTILHVDMDAFFVSVELLRRPELRGRPVVVGGAGRRGVVAAASYEARAYGVHSAMPSAQARRLCPAAVFLPGDHAHYGEVSRRVMAIFGRVTPLVEPLSLDEAFLDVRGARRLLGPATDIAARIRRDVLDEEGLTCSVGVAPNKFIAKMASEAAKPRASRQGPRPGRGVVVVERGAELSFLHPQPASRLWGVGPKTLARLERLGVRTIGDLAALPLDPLRRALGEASAEHLHRLAHGIDDRTVQPDQKAKSIGHEETFAHDLHERAAVEAELVRLADAVAWRLRRGGVAGRTVSIKVRRADFTTMSRSLTLPDAVDSAAELARAAKTLVADIDLTGGIRLLGVSVAKLGERPARQLTLDDVGAGGRAEVDAAVDEIRARFGVDAIAPAVTATTQGGRAKRRGDQQWGPAT